MDNPKISVIVPVYNVEPYLRCCLDSIVNQTYKNLEIILVDDGSPDNSGAICDEYASQDARITVIHKENGGLSAARNSGIEHAEGEFLCFIDADDMVHYSFVEVLHNACVRTGAKISVCNFCVAPQFLECTQTVPSVYTSKQISMKLCTDSTGTLSVTWNKLYASALFREIKFPVGRIHEDDATTYRLFWECTNCAVVSDVLYFYRQRENSIVNSDFSEKRMDAAIAYLERADFYVRHNENQMADLTKAVCCYFLLIHRHDIQTNLPNPDFWLRELRSIFKQVVCSVHISAKKKLNLIFLSVSPWLYRQIKTVYGALQNSQIIKR